jgi:heterodisulfide reductase subunit A-like polyferredoxin
LSVPLFRSSFSLSALTVTITALPLSPLRYAQRLNSPPRKYLPLLRSQGLTVTIQTRGHDSAKKAALQIRFVIVGGGAAGLSCAVALRRVGHEVIVLEKGPNFIGVRTLFTPAIPFAQWIAQPSKYRGIRMPPNMTKVFNYWGMRDKVGEIGLVTGRIVMSKRTRCFTFITSCQCLTALLYS